MHMTGTKGAFLDASEPIRTQQWPTSVTHYQCANALCAASATTLCYVFNNNVVRFDVDLMDRVQLLTMYTVTEMTGQLTFACLSFAPPALMVLLRWLVS